MAHPHFSQDSPQTLRHQLFWTTKFFSTKCTRKSLKITLQWEPLASIFHCLKHHSSARPWESVYSTGLVFHFHLFRGGNKENKHGRYKFTPQRHKIPPLPQLLPDGFPHPEIPPHSRQRCREVADFHLSTPAGTWLCAGTGTSSLSAAVIRNPDQPGAAACLESTWHKPTHSFVAVRRNSLVHCG